MKTTLGKIVASTDGLKALIDVKLPVKTAYAVSKLVNGQLNSEIKAYEEARLKLIKEYGTENDDKSISVKPDKISEFMGKIEELQAMEVELNFTPIKIEELGDVKLEPRHIVDFIFE